jgi:hypothetical protein
MSSIDQERDYHLQSTHANIKNGSLSYVHGTLQLVFLFMDFITQAI